MNEVIAIYKQKGETPLHALDKLRIRHPKYANEKLSYAGRLDPLAEGVLLVLVGEANKERGKYINLEKNYVSKILLGVSTDTHDVLGIIKDINPIDVDERIFSEKINSFIGSFSQKYPNFSSKTIGGTALHELTRKEISFETPSHIVELKELRKIKKENIYGEQLLLNARKLISLIVGDFRQEEILKSWNNAFLNKEITNSKFNLFEIELEVSSGFYVRQFAYDLGEKLGVPALAFSIVRTKVGKWGILDCI